MIFSCKRRGFTLIELLVVIAMIATIVGALSTSVSGAMTRAKVQKATTEVKTISQAIMSAEYVVDESAFNTILSIGENVEISSDVLNLLIGDPSKRVKHGNYELPALLQANLASNGKLLDPWNMPYKISVKSKVISINNGVTDLKGWFSMPNMNRLSVKERR